MQQWLTIRTRCGVEPLRRRRQRLPHPGAAKPALTIMALASRLADFMAGG
jgi:hypothetical protein